MRKNIAFIVLIAIFTMVGCADEDYSVKHSAFEWYSTLEEADSMFLEVGEKLDFADLSLNPIDRKWTIESGSYFLERTFTNNDSIYDGFILGDALESEEQYVSVLFNQAGKTTVKLSCTFDSEESITWFAPDTDTLYPTKTDDGLWQFDTVMVVDVYKKLEPSFKVLKNGAEIISISENDMPSIDDSVTWTSIDIKEGDILEYIDLTEVGRPTSAKWTIQTGASEPLEVHGDTAEIQYNIVGNYIAGTMSSLRNGAGVPHSTVDKTIPLKVNVDFSSAPISLNTDMSITEDATEKITVPVTGLLAKTQGSEGNFTVHVKNGDFEQDIAVSSVAVNTSDATKLEIKLVSPIYNTDTITVSYDGQGGITNASGFRVLSAFDATSVEMYWEAAGDTEMLSFETGDWPTENWADLWQTTSEKAFDGEKSYKFSSDNGANTKVESADAITIPAGKYRVQMSFYKPSGCAINSIPFYVLPWKWAPWDVSSIDTDTWVTLETAWEVEADITTVGFGVKMERDAPGFVGIQDIYLDNIQFLIVEDRP